MAIDKQTDVGMQSSAIPNWPKKVPSNAELAIYITEDGEITGAQQKNGNLIDNPGRNVMGSNNLSRLYDPPELLMIGNRLITLLNLRQKSSGGPAAFWWPYEPSDGNIFYNHTPTTVDPWPNDAPQNAELIVYCDTNGIVVACQKTNENVLTSATRNMTGGTTLNDPPELIVKGNKPITLMRLYSPSTGANFWWPHNPFTCDVYCP